MRLMIGGLIVAGLTAPLCAQDGTKLETTVRSEAEKKVCRSEQIAGSIMLKRTCKTRAEWAAIAGKGEAATDWMRDHKVSSGLGESL